MHFCDQRGIDPLSYNVNNVLEFLAMLYNKGLGYSALNTARSALGSLLSSFEQTTPIGKHYLVKRFMRGVFILRPSLPRYNVTWDCNKVLVYLKQFTLDNIDLRQLTMKVIMLLCLLSGQRLQSVHLIKTDNIEFNDNYVKIRIKDLVKQSRPGIHLNELVFEKYSDSSLCIVLFLKAYLKRTDEIRKGETSLFISYCKPYKKVTKDTIARWVKSVMQAAGIDNKIFKAHSTRAASVSKAHSCRLPLSTILRTAGWSKDSVFRKFYKKPITNDTSFAQAILCKNID